MMEQLTPVRSLFEDTKHFDGKTVKVGGWVRNLRASKNFGFINLSDGTYFSQVQVAASCRRFLQILSGEKMQPEKVVYVSCDSATLARDLKYLCANGYEIRMCRGVDQFPQSVHVETCVLLSKLGQ